jgi:hypothetical protein
MATEDGGSNRDAKIPDSVRVVLAHLTSGDIPRAEAAATLAAIAHRATNDLYRIARAESGARRGSPEWGAWAALANAARDAVLKMAAIRRTANDTIINPPSMSTSAEKLDHAV